MIPVTGQRAMSDRCVWPWRCRPCQAAHSQVSGSIPVEEQSKTAASWAALDTLEKAAHAFGQMPGSLLGQFSLSRAWFPSEGVKTALGAEEGAVLAHVFVLTSQWHTLCLPGCPCGELPRQRQSGSKVPKSSGLGLENPVSRFCSALGASVADPVSWSYRPLGGGRGRDQHWPGPVWPEPCAGTHRLI